VGESREPTPDPVPDACDGVEESARRQWEQNIPWRLYDMFHDPDVMGGRLQDPREIAEACMRNQERDVLVTELERADALVRLREGDERVSLTDSRFRFAARLFVGKVLRTL
jgi:hypothetical protein